MAKATHCPHCGGPINPAEHLKEHLETLPGATELARNEHGDVLWGESTGCYLSKARGGGVAITTEHALEGLVAISAGQHVFEHWCLSAAGERVLASFVPAVPF